MPTLLRCTSEHKDFQELVKLLDKELAIYDGEDHAFYDQYNKIDKIQHVVVLYVEDRAVACGALREFEPGAMEVKRMYTRKEDRGNAYAKRILDELEAWAREMNYSRCVLETGLRQVEAVKLYSGYGYQRVPNYGPYIGVENSVCFEKRIS